MDESLRAVLYFEREYKRIALSEERKRAILKLTEIDLLEGEVNLK